MKQLLALMMLLSWSEAMAWDPMQYDSDYDGVPDMLDVCLGYDDTIDVDGNGIPDGCDSGSSGGSIDSDGDGVDDMYDSCPYDNPDDSDGDGICDSNDVCPGYDDHLDDDGDGVPNGCDSTPIGRDTDGDGYPDMYDMCPLDNPDDSDGDGICDSNDACPGHDDNLDDDGDGVPNGCDPTPNGNDTDGDGTPDMEDMCPNDPDNDSDGDGICQAEDRCPGWDDRQDADLDGIPDACDVPDHTGPRARIYHLGDYVPTYVSEQSDGARLGPHDIEIFCFNATDWYLRMVSHEFGTVQIDSGWTIANALTPFSATISNSDIRNSYPMGSVDHVNEIELECRDNATGNSHKVSFSPGADRLMPPPPYTLSEIFFIGSDGRRDSDPVVAPGQSVTAAAVCNSADAQRMEVVDHNGNVVFSQDPISPALIYTFTYNAPSMPNSMTPFLELVCSGVDEVGNFRHSGGGLQIFRIAPTSPIPGAYTISFWREGTARMYIAGDATFSLGAGGQLELEGYCRGSLARIRLDGPSPVSNMWAPPRQASNEIDPNGHTAHVILGAFYFDNMEAGTYHVLLECLLADGTVSSFDEVDIQLTP